MNKEDLDFNPAARAQAISKAWVEYEKYKDQTSNDYIVVINMREPSYRKRMYVIDLNAMEVVRNHHCSHGVGSSNPRDRAYAINFSNVPNSHKSSLGAMKTGRTYKGKHGYSLKLHGLEKGINDNVEKRYIVVHSAHYVTNQYILRNGRAGQSHGCPAVDPYVCRKLIDLIKDGVFFYVYY